MTELDLLLIRQREHEMASAELQLKLAEMTNQSLEIQMKIIQTCVAIGQENLSHVQRLESKGHDYLTITAEMARIRAEVRGEK